MERAIAAALASFDIPEAANAAIRFKAVEGDVGFPERLAGSESAWACADDADAVDRDAFRHDVDGCRYCGLVNLFDIVASS